MAKVTCVRCNAPAKRLKYCYACRIEINKRQKKIPKIPKQRSVIRRIVRCIYCGDLATVKDHTIPVSSVTIRKRTNWSDSQNKDFQVPSCRECNGLLFNHIFPTMDDRMWFLLKKLNKRYPNASGDDLKRIKFLERVISLQMREEALQSLTNAP